MKLKISITAAHIGAATPYPNSSPIALALRDMGYQDATVGRYYVAFGGDAYPLPNVAVDAEIQFDYLAKNKCKETINPYEFELDV